MILVLGGNGYIGSETNLHLLEKGYQTIVFDKKPVDYLEKLPSWNFFQGDPLDLESLRKVFSENKIEGVIHFAASIEVFESQQNPQKYYYNNVVGTLNLLQIMLEFEVKNIVFSSTAAVYGIPFKVPILETDQKNPINCYGRTKLMIEQILADYNKAYGLNSICLRYFNASGADSKLRTGENHQPESHLIPIVLQVAKGEREFLQINGSNYNTKDGTCIRDYISTSDLAEAHILALESLLENKLTLESINLGTQNGTSILEIIKAVEKVTGIKIKSKIGPKRPGDPDILIADNSKAKTLLGWEALNSDIENIIENSWNWYNKIN